MSCVISNVRPTAYTIQLYLQNRFDYPDGQALTNLRKVVSVAREGRHTSVMVTTDDIGTTETLSEESFLR